MPGPQRRTPLSANLALALAVAIDVALSVAKFVAFAMTGSASMLSEALHSLADVSNQLLLAIGVRASSRPPDESHPYGYGRERPFWALLSASGVLFVGAGATLWNAGGRLIHPEPLEHLELGLAILGFALVSGAVSMTVALRTVAREAQSNGVSLREAFTRSGDPVLVAIIAEDAAGLAGVLSAATGVGLAYALDNPVFDAIGALGVGLVMAVAALFLIDRNRQLLTGASVPDDRSERLVAVLADNHFVRSVRDVKTTAIDESTVRLKAEVAFDGAALAKAWMADNDPATVVNITNEAEARAFLEGFADDLVERLGTEVDRIEADIRATDSDVRHIDLELD